MREDSLTFVLFLFQIVGYGLFLVNVGKQKYPKWASFCAYVGNMIAMMLLFWDGMGEQLSVRAISSILVLILHIWVSKDEPPLRKLLLVGLHILVLIVADLFSSMIAILNWNYTFAGLLFDSATNSLWLLAASCYPIWYLFFSTVALSLLSQMEWPVRRKIILLSLLLAGSQSLLLVGLGTYNWVEVRTELFRYVIACVFVAILCQYYVYQAISSAVSSTAERMELEQLKLQRELDYKYYQLAQTNAAELASFRHDFKNQLQVAYALAEQEPAQAVKLLGELEERLGAIHPVRYCENPIVNTVLTLKAAQAAELGIDLSVQAAVADWAVEEADLTSLFSNLLDNAIEGCQRSGAERPFLRVRAAERQGFYIVKVSNSCGADVRPEGTSKPEREGHGLGLNILRGIARKYQGEFRTQVEQGVFTAQLTLTAEPRE